MPYIAAFALSTTSSNCVPLSLSDVSTSSVPGMFLSIPSEISASSDNFSKSSPLNVISTGAPLGGPLFP